MWRASVAPPERVQFDGPLSAGERGRAWHPLSVVYVRTVVLALCSLRAEKTKSAGAPSGRPGCYRLRSGDEARRCNPRWSERLRKPGSWPVAIGPIGGIGSG